MKTKISLFILSVFAATSSFAQIVSGGVSAGATASRLQDSIAEKMRQEQIAEARKEFKEQKEKREIKETPVGDKSNDVKNIEIKTISFSPSEILSKEFLDSIKKEFEGKTLSVNDIQSIVTKINNEYMLKGALGAKAYLPEQDISSGNLFISLVEGRVRDIKFEGNKHTSDSYIKEYFEFAPYDLVDINKMQEDVLYFNSSNDAKARLALEPGPVYGTSDVNVIVTEPDTFSTSVFTDNAGQTQTGLYRVGGYAVLRSLTGRRDILTGGGTWAEGAWSAFGSYEIPEPLFDGRIGFGGDYSNTQIINGDLKTLDVSGDFYNLYVYYKKPFWLRENVVNNFTVTVATKNGKSYISGQTLPDGTKTNIATLGFDNLIMFENSYLYNNISGGASFGAANDNFYKFNYMLEYQYLICEDFTATLRGRAQYGSDDPISSSDQFQIGGVNTVRGYSEGALLANSGINGSVELQYDFANIIAQKPVLSGAKLFVFFDYGTTFSNSKSTLPNGYYDSIYSAGAGVRMSLWQNVDANLIFAQPLVSQPYTNDGQQFLFYVQVNY